MKIVGLKEGEFIQLEKSRIVKLSQGHYLLGTREIRISYNDTECFVDNDVEILKIESGSLITLYYQNPETLEKKSKEEILAVQRQYIDSEGDYSYPNLETEFAHRKVLLELDKFKPVKEQQEDKFHKVELKCVGTSEETGSKFITSAISIGNASFGNSGFYRLDISSLAQKLLYDFVDKHNLRSKFENSTHSNVYYAKISGTYVLTSLEYTKENNFKFFTSLDIAKETERHYINEIESTLKLKVFGENLILDHATLLFVTNSLENIQRSVAGLGVKQASAPSQRATINLIRDLSNKLKELM